jgi:hypothetical protein
MVKGFLRPRLLNLRSFTRLEQAGLIAGISGLTSAFLTYRAAPPVSSALLESSVATLGAVLGSLVRGLRWRALISRHAVDPNAVVYWSRGDYAKLLEYIEHAAEVDVIGISLRYYLEYILDSPGRFTGKVRRTRILLPGTRDICDGRDYAQGGSPGALWSQLNSTALVIQDLRAAYPRSLSARYFSVQPYFAMTRIDDDIWISPYITAHGRSSPVIAVSRQGSPELYKAFKDHFENIWQRSTETLPDHDEV